MKNLKTFFLLILISVLLFSSCSCIVLSSKGSAEKKYNSTWVGQSYDDVLRTYPNPQRTLQDSRGVILAYEKQSEGSDYDMSAPENSSDLDASPYVAASPVKVKVDTDEIQYTYFFFDQDNICYQVKTNIGNPSYTKRLANREKRTRIVDHLLDCLAPLGALLLVLI